MSARLILYGYVIVYFVAACVAIIGTQGYFGFAPDGLAAVYLILVGLPWSLIATLQLVGWHLTIVQVLVFLAPLINVWLLWRFTRK